MEEKNTAIQWLDSQAEELAALSDKIWDCPELRFEERTAARLQCGLLERYGFEVTEGLAGIPTAFCGKYGQGRPVIGILGEFDALPGMSQQAGVSEKRPADGMTAGHGCGHNLLGAGSLGAAAAAAQYLRGTGREGTVVYFGCPAEEGGSGKAFLARAGVFRDVDAALSWHPGAFNRVWSASSLANVQVKYRFSGVSAHAAVSPHTGRSALDALTLMNVGVQFLREHIVPEARVHYAVSETGGLAPNVVQDKAEAIYLIRAPRNDQVQEIFERVNLVARGAAMMTETQVEIKMDKACSNLLVNQTLEKVLYGNLNAIERPAYTQEDYDYGAAIQGTLPKRQTAAAMLGRYLGAEGREQGALYDRKSLYSFVVPYLPSENPIPGSTDVGDVSWCCPTSQFIAATCAGGTVEHSWQMVAQGKSGAAHKGLLYAAKVLAASAIDLLENPELLREAREEFLERAGEGYRPLLTPDVQPAVPAET